MAIGMRLEDSLDGASNFRSWRSRITLIMEENDLIRHVKEVVSELDDEVGKERHEKNGIKTKWVLMDSIKDHLIPNISELENVKQKLDTLIKDV